MNRPYDGNATKWNYVDDVVMVPSGPPIYIERIKKNEREFNIQAPPVQLFKSCLDSQEMWMIRSLITAVIQYSPEYINYRRSLEMIRRYSPQKIRMDLNIRATGWPGDAYALQRN